MKLVLSSINPYNRSYTTLDSRTLGRLVIQFEAIYWILIYPAIVLLLLSDILNTIKSQRYIKRIPDGAISFRINIPDQKIQGTSRVTSSGY